MSDVRIDDVRRLRDGRLHVMYSRRRADGEFGKGPDKIGIMLPPGLTVAELRAQAAALIPVESLVMMAAADFIEGGEVAKSLDRTVLSFGEVTKTVQAAADEVKR